MNEKYSDKIFVGQRGNMMKDIPTDITVEEEQECHPPTRLLNTVNYLGKQILSTKETMDAWKKHPEGFVAVIEEFMKTAKFDLELPFFFRIKEGELILTQIQHEEIKQ